MAVKSPLLIEREEHDETLLAKKTSVVSSATIYAVVNTAGAGTTTVTPVGLTTLAPSPNFVGLVTVNIGSSNTVDTELPAASALADGAANPTAPAVGAFLMGINSSNQWERVRVGSTQGLGTTGVPNVMPMLYNGADLDTPRTANAANATTGLGLLGSGVLGFDGTNYRRIITGTDGRIQGNVTVNAIVGNVTLSDPKTFIGLVTGYPALSSVASTDMPSAFAPPVNSFLMGFDYSAENWNPLRVDGVGIPDAYAVGSGGVKLQQEASTNYLLTTNRGNITLSDSKTYIGLTTSTLGVSDRYIGLVTNTQAGLTTLAPSPNFIGIVSVAQPISTTFSGNVTLDDGSLTGIVGNVTLSDAKTYIGLTTTTLGLGSATIGKVSALQETSPWVVSATDLDIRNLDSASDNVAIKGNVTLSDPKTYVGLTTSTLGIGDRFVGLATVVISSTVTVSNLVSAATLFAVVNAGSGGTSSTDDAAFTVATDAGTPFMALADETSPDLVNEGDVGVVRMSLDRILKVSVATLVSDANVTVAVNGNITLSDSKNFIGLVTAWSRNAGTTKTLVNLPIAISTNSIVTIVVPTNDQKINITNLVLNSDATVRVAFKSGVTYLTGNASIGVTLNPGGGWIQTGSPDSPSWIGLPSGAFVVEKLDITATLAKIGGNVIYFDE